MEQGAGGGDAMPVLCLVFKKIDCVSPCKMSSYLAEEVMWKGPETT